MNAIEIRALNKIYAGGNHALQGIDITVADGDFFALLGVNGAGKTTTIAILTGLVTKTGGSASVFGYDLDTQLNQVKQQIGVVPQEFNFNIFEKVINIITAQAGYYGIPKSIALERAETILKKLELWDRRSAVSRTLSGGMKRRLMIARALMHHPRLLILDEPTAGVDVELRRGMWDYLRELNASGVTVLLTTHYLEEVEQLCNNAAVIHHGKIILNDSVRALLSTVERETIIATVNRTDAAANQTAPTLPIEHTVINEHEIEFTLDKDHTLTDLIKTLDAHGIVVAHVRSKSNRMEELFLTATKKS